VGLPTDWIEIQPYKLGAPRTVICHGRVSPQASTAGRLHRRHYFKHPSHWLIDGRLLLGIRPFEASWRTSALAATRRRSTSSREDRRGRFPGLHLNAVVGGQAILPGEESRRSGKLVKVLGFDSVTSYVWIHHVALPRSRYRFGYVRDKYFEYRSGGGMFDAALLSNATMGWGLPPSADQSDPFVNAAIRSWHHRQQHSRGVKRRWPDAESGSNSAGQGMHPVDQLLERMDRGELPRAHTRLA
jgi:hypothetical protein